MLAAEQGQYIDEMNNQLLCCNETVIAHCLIVACRRVDFFILLFSSLSLSSFQSFFSLPYQQTVVCTPD